MRRAFALAGAALLAACGRGGAPPSPSVPIAPVAAKPDLGAPDPCARQAPAVDASEALGRPIHAICLRGAPSGEVVTALARVMKLRAGTRLTPEALRAELARIWATGLVDDITTEARAGGTLDVIVRERPVVTQVTVAGASSLRDVAGELSLLQGERFAVGRLKSAAARVRQRYVEAGFEDAEVRYEATPSPKNLVRVRFTVVEGQASRVGRLSFPGAKRVSDAELERATGLTTGDLFEGGGVDHAAVRLASLYQDRGMIHVDVQVERGARGKDGAVPVTFKIVEGDVFKLGKLRVSMPSDPAREKTFAAMLRVKPGGVFSRSAIAADLDRVRGATSASSVEPEIAIDAKAKTVNLTIVVKP